MIADHVGGAITYVSPEVRSKGVTTRLHNLARDAGLATEARREVQSQQNASIESKRDDGSADLAPAPVAPAASLASPQLTAFDDPFHGAAVSDQTQRLEHDVRMHALGGPDLPVRRRQDGAWERISKEEGSGRKG